MKRLITFLLCLSMLATLFLTACTPTDDPGDDTGSSSDVTDTKDPGTDSEDETDPIPTEPGDPKLVDIIEIGFQVVAAHSRNEKIATVEIDEDDGGVVITPRYPGTTVVVAKNNYAESVEITVTVGRDNQIKTLDYETYQVPKNVVYAKDYGMDPSKYNNTSALQAAINAAHNKGGGVVYISKGNYNIGLIELKANVTLHLEGVIDNYNTAMSDTLAKQIKSGEYFACLNSMNSDMFANHPQNGNGAKGADNFGIKGGVINMKGRRAFIWTCADGPTLESVIMKDAPNNHAIQVTGSTNVVIRDVMFAGAIEGDASTELIQIETSHPGAIGMGYGAGSVFAEHEYYHCANVLIENCYFGKSDLHDTHNIPIGHHGHASASPVTGLSILNCTFDNPRIMAIRAFAFSDVEITGCQFISDRNNVISENNYMIQFTFSTGDIILSNSPKVFITKAENRGGCQNYQIHDNEFYIGEDSLMCGILCTLQSTKYSAYEAIGYSNLMLTERSTSPASEFNGYMYVNNKVSDIYFYDNKITAENDLCSTLYSLTGVRGLLIKNNECKNNAKMTVSSLDGEAIEGAKLTNCLSARKYAEKFRVATYSSITENPIVMKKSEGKINAFCTASDDDTKCVITFECEDNGTVVGEIGSDNNVYITPVADEGYVFDGYYYKGAKIDVSTFEFQKDVTVKLKFVKK